MTYLNSDGLSELTVQGIPAARSSGNGCSLMFLQRCRSSFEMGHSSMQIPGLVLLFLNFSTRWGCFMRAKPWPMRFDLSTTASYRFELAGSVEPPVSSSVSPAWNKKGMSRFFSSQVFLNATSSSL